MAKKQLDVEEAKPKKKRSNNKRRGSAFELEICHDLRNIGFNVVTSRAESRNMDNMKVDIIDKDGQLCYIQAKRTVNYPNYLEIRDSCPLKDKPFVVIWNQQKKTDKTFRSAGKMAILDLDFFYELIKHYYGKV